MEEEKRRRKVEAGKAKLAEFRQRKAKGDVANPEKEKKKGKRTPLHQHGLSTEEHALTAGEMEVGVETIVEAGLGEQIPSVDDAPGGLGSVEPETTEDRSSEVPSLPTDRDTDGLMALEITQFEAAIQQRDEIITQLSANLQQALSSRDGVQQETQHLTTHIQSLQQQLQQASEMLRSTRQWTQTQELVQAQQQLSTCQNLLCEKTSELNRLRSRLELAHATRQPGAEGSLGTRPDGLAQEGAADHEEHTLILQKELQESKTIASQLEATISQKEAIILTLQQTLPSKDKAPTSTSTSPTGTERAAFCELTEKVGEAERTVTELQREVSSKDLALEDLRMRLSASAEKEQQLSRENVKLFNDLDNLAKKQGHLDGNLTEVAESNWERREGELRTALGEERDQQVAALRSEMQREVERLQAVIEDLTESNRRSHESLLLLEESNGQLNTSLRDSQAQLASGQEQLSSVLSESTEMDARYGRELENFRVKLEMLENERTEARARVAELEELNAELSFGREEAQRALEQIREQQEKDTEGLRVALGLEYKGSIDKLTADIENLTVALSQSAEELRSTKETLQRQYIEEMKGLKESLRQEHKENVNKLLADNEKLTAELSLGKEVVKSELGNVPTDENDPLGIRDKCNREVENEKDADVQEYKENLEKLEAELEKLRGDLVHNTREAQSALEEQRQQHIAEVESLKDTLGQQHKGSLDKLLADIQNLTVMLSQHEQEAQSTLEKQQQQHLIDKEAQKATLDQEHKGNIDKLLGDLKRLKEELLNNKEEAQCSLEKMKQQHSIEMEGLKETLRQENRVTMDKLQAEVEKLNNERSQSRQEADSRYEQMQQDYSRQVEQLKEQRMGVQDDACRLEQLLQHHREEVEALKEALRLEHKGAVDKLLNDTETLNAELSLSRQGAREAQEQLQQQQSLHTEEVQSICEQHIKELETLKETTGQEHAIKVDKLTADIEKLGAELSLRREEEQHATVELQEQHARELERLKESLAQEHKLNTDKLLAELEKIHGLTLKDSQEKQKDIDDLAKQLEEKHRLSLELALKGAENQSKVANEESKAELESKHAEELAALKEDFREKVEKLIQENKSFELEQLETEEGISGILRELEYCATFQETLEISGSTCDNVEASGPALVPSNPSGKAVANPQESPPKPDDDTASQKQGRQLKQLLCALSRQCIAMKGRVQAHVLEKNLREPAAQYQCESEPAPDASPHSVVDGGGTAGAKSSGGGDQTQGQSATTISTAVPSADEFNALLQEKAALEERVGDLRKTCDLQQEEMASLKAQAASDDEVAEEEKEVVVRKGRGGVAHLNVGSQGDVQTRLVEELDLPGATGPSPQAALSHVPQQPYLLHKLQKGKDECRFDLKSVDPSPAEMAHGLSNLYSQETKLTTQFPTSLTVTVESRTPNESENPLETAGFTAGDNTVLLVGSSQLRGYCEQYPDEGSSSYPAISSSHQFADVCASPNGPSARDIQALFNSVDGPSQQQQEDNPSGFDVSLNHAAPVDRPVVISKYNVVPGCDPESESTVDPLRSPDMESLDRPLVLTHPSRSEPDGDSLARDFDHWRPEEFAEGFSEMMVTIPLPVGPLVPCAGDSGIDVHTWLYRCRGSRGSGGSGRHRLTAQISLPSPPFAVEQASGVQVSLLKGWASGSPPHHGIDDKATTAPPPAEQEACEDGVQQQQQQQHHGQTDSESEQKSKTQLEKQEAELQEQAGRVMVQVQVQQKGQKQQQQRKHHRKQQKKHPGMVLVQHMSVVPEEGQEDQCGAQADKDDAKRWDMPSSQAALQVAVDAQRASLEEVHALRLALAMKEEELEALRVCMSTPQGAVELAGESGSHSEEDAAEPSHADSDGRQQTQLSKVAKDKAAATMSKNLPSQQLLLAALEGPMPEPDTDTTGDTVCTKAALSVADSEHPIQGQHLHLESVPPQKDLARGWQKSGPCRGSSPSQGTIPGETRKLSRKETMNKQKPAGRSANVKKEPASQTKPSSRAARATPPMALPCGTCTQLEAERDDLVEVLRMEREACQHLRQRLQVLQQERSRPAIGGDADVAGSVPSRGDRSTGRGDLDVEQRTGSPCELVEGATPGGTDCGDQSEHVETRREEPDGPSLPVIEGSASGVGTEMQASTCVKAAEKLSLLSGSRTEEGTADTEMSNGNRDIAGPSEGSGLVACDGSSSSRTAGLSSNSTDLSRRHGLLQCACRRLQLVSTTTRDLLAQISIRVISVVDLTRDEELAQLLRRLKELDAEIAHSEADLTWDSRLASGDPLGRVARQLSELYGRMTVLSEEKEALNAVVLDLTRLLQQREQTPPPRLTGGPEPAPTWRSDRQLVPPPRRASRGSPASERAMLCVPIGKFQSLHRRFTRAESQRRALLHQKRYLLLVLGSFAGTEQPALALLARPRVELLLIARETAANAATRRRFRVVARAVAATCRLRMLLQKQQQQQRQRGCTAHGWKVDMPVTTFSTPGRHYLWS
ncbi:A-kinase anchor protein 9-like isoform X5 [Lethenteron reissneri]|uniref:A-kinase anchor protein 9-like isoform X5 n=1 Tax=Lethenteron reissneri TaxID=7753 RepID=UPI002AB5FD2D|nr:A-kinase anchor protein 9-like isoform X5 [Lethenteron reissneri]